MITNNYSLTINGYECKLNKPLKFYQGDSLHLIFTVNQYEWVINNGNRVRAIMPINPLKAFLIIENPEDEATDTVESAFVENDEIHFHIDSKYTSFVGVGRMQLVLADDGCCNVTIPEFTYEIKKNITDKLLNLSKTTLIDTDNKVLMTDSGDDMITGLALSTESNTSKYIKDLPNKETIDGEESVLIQDQEGTKNVNMKVLLDDINSRTNLADIQNQIRETNAQLSADKKELQTQLSQKVEYPVMSWEKEKVVNITYEYGDVRRYGARGDGVSDDTNPIQIALDLCSLSGYSVLIKNGTYLVESPLILKDYRTSPSRIYRIKGDDKIPDHRGFDITHWENKGRSRIIPKNNLFWSGSSEIITCRLLMDGLSVEYVTKPTDVANKYNIFENITLNYSVIENNVFSKVKYFFNEGTLNTISYIKNNIFNRLSCLISSNVSTYDCYILNNHFEGNFTENPTLFKCNSLDVGMLIQGNFIDQFAWIYGDYNDIKGYLNTGMFVNNNVNICYRLRDGFINEGYISGNIFERCSFKYAINFTNATYEMINGSWGGIVLSDNLPSGTFGKVLISHNTFYETDVAVKIKVTPERNVRVLNKFQTSGNIGANIDVLFANEKTSFKSIDIEEYNYSEYDSLPSLYYELDSSGRYVNIGYEGLKIWVGDELYIAHWGNYSNPKFLKIL